MIKNKISDQVKIFLLAFNKKICIIYLLREDDAEDELRRPFNRIRIVLGRAFILRELGRRLYFRVRRTRIGL